MVAKVMSGRMKIAVSALGLLLVAGVVVWRLMARRKPGSSASETGPGFAETRQHAEHPHVRPDNSDPDDETLRDRIQSELFRDPRIPKDKINISVALRTVDVRGEVDSEEDKQYIEDQVRLIAGVGSVRSYLHLPGTDAPNKAEAIEASDGSQRH